MSVLDKLHLITFNGVHISRFFGAQNIPKTKFTIQWLARPKTRCQQNAAMDSGSYYCCTPPLKHSLGHCVPVAPPNPMDFAGFCAQKKSRPLFEFGPTRKSLPNHDISFTGCASFESEKNISTWKAWLAQKKMQRKSAKITIKKNEFQKHIPGMSAFLLEPSLSR